MLVRCKMIHCPYYDNREFCSKPTIVGIDEMGMCSVLWRKGQQKLLKLPFDDKNYPKEKAVIIDVEEKDIKTIEKEEKEGAVPVEEISEAGTPH